MFDKGDPAGARAAVLDPCFEALRRLDPAACSADDVRRRISDLGRLRSLIDSVEAALNRQADRLHAKGESADSEDLMASEQRASASSAKKRAKRAKALEKAPAFDDALADGTITAEHADALAGVADSSEPDVSEGLFAAADELAEAAATMRPDTFKRHLRRKADQLKKDDGLDRFERQRRASSVRRRIEHATGLYHLHAILDPELGAKIFGALEDEIETRWHSAKDIPDDQRPSNDRIAAEALADLVAWGVTDRRSRHADVSIIVDYETMLDGLHDDGVCETRQGVDIPPETARRLACDAQIVPIVMGGPSQPLDVGRASRTATPAQRKALRAAHPTCGVDDCDVRFDFCAIHHIIHWVHGGHTDLDNLVPLCHRHHHQVHEGRWTIELGPDRSVRLTAPMYAEEQPAPTSPSERRPASAEPNTTQRTRATDQPRRPVQSPARSPIKSSAP